MFVKNGLIKQYRGLPKEIYVIFLARVVNSLGAFVMPMLSLILTRKIGMTKGEAGFYATMLSCLCVPGMLIGGKLTDKIGRKKILVIFQGAAAVIFLACGFLKPNHTMAYVLMLSPLVAAFSFPAQEALLADITTPENRKEAYSLTYMGWNLGFAIGPLIGGMLFEKHLNWVFIGDAFTTLVSLVLVVVFIKETIHRNDEIDDSRVLEKKEEGSVFKVLMKRPILVTFALITAIYNFSYNQWGFGLSIQMGDVFTTNGARYYGLMGALNGAVVILFTPFASRITHGIEPLKVISAGGILYALSFTMFGYVSSLPWFLAGVVILTMGEVIITINQSTFVANSTPSSHRGRVGATVNMIAGFGGAISPMIMGNAFQNLGYRKSWTMIGVMMVTAAFFMWQLIRMKKAMLEKDKQKVEV